jgi:anti-anti-sigma factor
MFRGFDSRNRLETESLGDLTVVRFSDRKVLGHEELHVWDQLVSLVDELGRGKLLLDLADVEFWDTYLCAKLLTLHRKLQAAQGKLVLCHLCQDMLDVFRITKLDRLLTIVAEPSLVSTDDVIREVFGNPIRPVEFSPEWRASTAVVLAEGMYESRDFAAVPILADALRDAGCDSEEILNHLRDPEQVHVRGCWVVDLVLGKA